MMLAVVAFVVGCSVSPPVFMSVGAHLIVVAVDPDGGKEERLSIFASVSDKDGVDDIEYLYIVHDEEELNWTLTVDEWQRSDEGSSVWLGANSLDAPGPDIPRGAYRVVLVDKAGERAERTFLLNAPETSIYAVPALRLAGTDIVLDSAYSINTAFFFDSGGNVVLTAPLSQGTTVLDALWPKGQWRTGSDYIAAYGYDPKAETGFFSWKIRLPD
jgi:hypothetical protein